MFDLLGKITGLKVINKACCKHDDVILNTPNKNTLFTMTNLAAMLIF